MFNIFDYFIFWRLLEDLFGCKLFGLKVEFIFIILIDK